MTSAEFRTVPISSITISREERQRRVLDDTHIRELANSIAKRGLIHPPVISRSGELVVGECRVEALKLLGWTDTPVQYTDELDPKHLRSIELEENLRRKNLEWKDECLAVKEIHDLRKIEDPTQSLEDTGRELGYSKARISQVIEVANELLSGNARVLEAPKFSTARGIVYRTNERAKAAAIVGLTEYITPPKSESDPFITADFREWAPTYTGPKFNFIHCDFPYGIGANKFVQGAAPTHGGYSDDESLYWDLCGCLVRNLDRIATESCHLMFWYSMHYHCATLDFFQRNSDIRLDPFPLVWMKSDNVGIIPDPQRGPRRVYETALFGSRGDRKIVSPVANAFSGPSDRSGHMSTKSDPMLRHFFRMFVDSSTNFLDPTCGSGTSLRAAKGLGAKHLTGLEINPEFADNARLQLKASNGL